MPGAMCDSLLNLTLRHVIDHLEEYCNKNDNLLTLLPPGVKNKLLKACTVTSHYLNKGRVNLKHILPALLNYQTVAVDLTSVNAC
ncbi:unnamed protein product [Callosobruchus maculatus]|uniref:Uncharacterized protein n=1 Tax=Callosobruchus maculatus TaxID=64391 RepID=A0A653CFS5_CALMS|nr:unnamed protein product [Callosobruchus maculatus]